jgi:TPR repeat protein
LAGAGPIDIIKTVTGCSDASDCEIQCSKNNAPACVNLGRILEYGHGQSPDPARALRLYTKACELGYSGGCYNQALLLEWGKGGTKDLDRARQLFAKVCSEGGKTACEHAEALESPPSH